MAGHQVLIIEGVNVWFDKLQFLGIMQNKMYCNAQPIQMTVRYKFWQFVSIVQSSNICCLLSLNNMFFMITKCVSCCDREHSEM
jgi:hypothetical protein